MKNLSTCRRDGKPFPSELKRALFTVWRGPEDLFRLLADQRMAPKRRAREELKAVDALVERLREFVRFNYMTAAEVAREIGVNDSTVYSWLLGQYRPENPERLAEFLDSLPKENGSGLAPTGYQYREYKNWRGIPKPRRCPFCKQAKGEIRRNRGGFLGVCPNCEASGPKRDNYDEALRAWNGKGQ